MTNVWCRPFDSKSPEEFNLFVQWLHFGREANRYDPSRLFERQPDRRFTISPSYLILTLFNEREIVGFQPVTLAFLLDSLVLKPGLDPVMAARALQSMQGWLVNRAFQQRIPDAFFVTQDNSVLNFAVKYGWVAPDVPCLNLHFADLLPKPVVEKGGA